MMYALYITFLFVATPVQTFDPVGDGRGILKFKAKKLVQSPKVTYRIKTSKIQTMRADNVATTLSNERQTDNTIDESAEWPDVTAENNVVGGLWPH
jgi:hypothetical protein